MGGGAAAISAANDASDPDKGSAPENLGLTGLSNKLPVDDYAEGAPATLPGADPSESSLDVSDAAPLTLPGGVP